MVGLVTLWLQGKSENPSVPGMLGCLWLIFRRRGDRKKEKDGTWKIAQWI